MANVNPGPAIQGANNQPLVIAPVQQLFILPNANFAITADQKFTRVFSGTTWDPLFITANVVSGAYNTACLGGIFTAPAKGGSAIVSVGQSYSSMTGVGTHQQLTVQATTTTFTLDPYFSLSTANGAALFGDIFIWGVSYDR